MATHDYNLANQDGASFRSDLNNALAAIVSNNSSSTAPSTTFAHQIWVDTTANVIKQRNAANDAWIELWRIDGGFNAKTFSGDITLNAQSDLRFADSNSSNWVAFQSPAVVSSNVTWTLPDSDGSADQVLTTNGSGVLSFADAAGGTQDNITEGNTSAEVVDTGSDGHFKVVTEGNEAIRVDSSRRLLIGTNAAYDSYLGAATNRLQITGSSYQLGAMSAFVFGSTGTGAHLNLGLSRNATVNSHTVVQSGNTLGAITFNGSDGSAFKAGGLIQCNVDGTPGTNDMPGRLVFSTTADGASSPTERLRIAQSGAFGLSGANYGTSGQVLTSQGSGSAPQWATPAGGKVLQVVSTVKTSAFSTSSTSYTTITGLSASITPSSTSSKILVIYSVACGGRNSDNAGTYIRLYRNSTAPHLGDAAGSRERATMAINNQGANVDFYTGNYLDSPSTTSATTYSMAIRKVDGVTVYVNQENGQNDANSIYYGRYPSTITLMEIGA